MDRLRYWLGRNLRHLATKVEPTVEPCLGEQSLWWMGNMSTTTGAEGQTVFRTFPPSPENPYT